MPQTQTRTKSVLVTSENQLRIARLIEKAIAKPPASLEDKADAVYRSLARLREKLTIAMDCASEALTAAEKKWNSAAEVKIGEAKSRRDAVCRLLNSAVDNDILE